MTDTNNSIDLTPEISPLMAAIDIGSNSFHMVIARLEQEEIRPIERLGEKVQLAAGLVAGKLQDDAIQRGLECLRCFKQRLDEAQVSVIRVVGTNALRSAHNRNDFIVPAEEMLGVPVEVIAGREEARLVYLGVAHTQADDEEARLVIDIGGGSTELIVGRRFEANITESLHMGCVSYLRYFENGIINKQHFLNAYHAAYLELLNIRSDYHNQWQNCVGSSGTLLAIEQVLVNLGYSQIGIHRDGLKKLQKKILKFDHIDDVDFEGLKPTRRQVFCSGVAITKALFDALDIDQMRLSDGALREGVLYDLQGRLSHEDVRERTVAALEKRYDADLDLSGKVVNTVADIFRQVEGPWQLRESDFGLLQWAARLHEIGLTVSHSQFQKHGEYLIRHSDLAGFSRHQQELLAILVRSHRRKFSLELFESLSKIEREHCLKCAVILRLAIVLRYTETVDGLPPFNLSVAKKTLEIAMPEGWLEQHPLTGLDLESEKNYLQAIDYQLNVR